MTKIIHIEENTYREMAEAICPGHGHSKLARSAVEFMIKEAQKKDTTSLDVATLKNFVDFIIKEKGYN